MLKDNPNWLWQISDDFVLHSDFHNIIKNPGLFKTILKEK